MRLKVFVNGASQNYATLYDSDSTLLGTLSKDDWHSRNTILPKADFIRSDLKLSNQVHISQLIAQYKKQNDKAYEPVQLQTLASTFVSFDVAAAISEAAKSQNGTATPQQTQLIALQRDLEQAQFSTGDGGLERILFEEILKIPLNVLENIRDLRSAQHGYVEQLIEDMNHRLSESLDISEYWQQDEDFSVAIEYKAGFFYFLISDRTGAKYTFDERSGGLKYFLSYYIQAKAIRDSMGPGGSIIVMDEPDGFLSAAGQRNLLSVFELLAQPVKDLNTTKRCQIVYTTHSPFLINRNYPDRISLVRKGDGGEGTQLVELVSTRQYEPVRSGLGIESSEALFMGSENIVLEGVSEQRILVSAIQRFGDAARIDDMLDLNRLTVVSASGAWDVPRLLKNTKRSKEKQPVVAVFMDGDATGQSVRDEVVGERLIAAEHVCLISEANLSTKDWCQSPQTLEDLIPPRLIAHAVRSFAKTRWNQDQYGVDAILSLWNNDSSTTNDLKLATVITTASNNLAKPADSLELRAGVFESLARLLSGGVAEFEAEKESLQCLEKVVREVCVVILRMLKHARRQSRQDRLAKVVRLEVERFKKIHGKVATKADVRRCMSKLEVLPTGGDPHSVQTRENIIKLQHMLEEEVKHAGFPVDAPTWVARLGMLVDCPWTSKDFQ